ncbi:MAG: aminopeptidase P family protein [Cyanobacteria bacterium SID2]|nr:aminopeptidase P family protein [Cyanobacteria bacterium SID2]MBP0002209.1 aminopeptidase P family protein [Cyanobacteria bacterium SBC]
MLLGSNYPSSDLRDRTLETILRERRIRLAEQVDFPVVLWSGRSKSRNFPANTYPFRASSHFLYFAGLPLENAAVRLESGKLELFLDDPASGAALWHGEAPKRHEVARTIGADVAFPLSELPARAKDAATIAVLNNEIRQQQALVLERSISPLDALNGIDRELARAIVQLRLSHDAGALGELRQAAAVSVEAHKAGMAATKTAHLEARIRGAMEGVILSQNMTCAYNSIVTVHGEVLHNDRYHHPLQAGDLLLADVGAETPLGWASDITRTWPVNGQFSATQRAIYEVVLAAHDRAIEAVKPGVEYRNVHLLAAKVLAEGLVDLGILCGNPEDLVEADAHALFFPHGIGHLLGLDVHDMEDLGDYAGYENNRARSKRFGLCFLRLHRPLKPSMLVTIEPGFYQVPGILNNPQNREKYKDAVNWERLEQFADVRGIRIEDDVLVTEDGGEVTTSALPTDIESIEHLVSDSGRT